MGCKVLHGCSAGFKLQRTNRWGCLARGELTYDDLEVHHIVKLTDLLLVDGSGTPEESVDSSGVLFFI